MRLRGNFNIVSLESHRNWTAKIIEKVNENALCLVCVEVSVLRQWTGRQRSKKKANANA